MRLHTVLAALLLATAVQAPAIAQAATATSAQRDAQTLDAVEVEASAPRRQLNRKAAAGSRLSIPLKELPASVEVIDQQELRARGESTVVDALENAPGLVAAWSFGVINVAGRGFSGVFNSPTLFDGIRYPGWQVTPRSTLNYQSIEVLRGPAALAAGQGSVAGAINLVPRRATGADEGTLYLGLGRYLTQTAALGQGGQIGGLAWRADLSYQTSPQRGSFGYTEDTSFAFSHFNGELATDLGDDWRLSLSAESFRDDAEGYFGTPLINGRIDPALRERNYNIVDDQVEMRVNWLRARAEWNPGSDWSGRIVLFGNHEARFYRNTEAYTFLPATQNIRRSDYLRIQHDQEVLGVYADLRGRHSLLGRPHEVVVGIQADRNDHDRYSDSPFRYTDSVPLLPPRRGVYTSLDPFGLRTVTDIEQRSVFIESALDLSPRFKLVSGYRHDRSDVDSFNALSRASFDKRYSAGSVRAGLVWRATDSLNAYASWSTSSEPPAQITTLGLANASFDLTDAEQLEIGLKQDFDRGEWSLAVYDLSRTNILSRDPANPNRLIQIGEQAARGVELSARVDLAESWWMDLGASVLDARFERFDERVGNVLVSRRGNLPPAVPERMATAWLYWRPATAWTLGLGGRAVGRSAGNNANTVFLPGYATVDLLARYEHAWGQFGLRLRNVGDKLYATRPYNAANQFMLGEPRWYELSWQRSF